MQKKEAKELIKSLVERINQWNYEYYQLNKPSVSDLEYDKTLLELEKLEKEHPDLILNNSPTFRIGSFASEKFTKFVHQKPMLSLAKAYNYDDINSFINNISKIVPTENINFNIEPKIDGLSIALHYKQGKLVKAATRGDGSEGEDVTENIYQIKSIPKLINYFNDLEVRGEVFITKNDFKKINESNNFANARNAASGTLRQLDANIVAERNLSAFLYEIVEPEKHGIYYQHEALEFMKNLNFPTNPFSKVVEIEELEESISDFAEIKNKLDYDADGLVIKLNDLQMWDKLGKTSKFPKHSIAFKYDVEIASSKIIDILTSVGRTGKITYIANILPVLLNQTTVQAATLHNHNFIKDMNININDEVNIIKAGEIIPKVISLKEEKNYVDYYKKATNCPSCGSQLVEFEGIVDQFCTNDECPDKNINNIYHFASRNCLNIVGLGLSTVKDFYPKFIKNIKDIFDLHKYRAELIKLPRYRDLKVDNILNSIESAKNKKFSKVIFALGIKHIGQRAAKLIADNYANFAELLDDHNLIKLQNTKNIGPKIIESLIEFISSSSNQDLLTFLDATFNYEGIAKVISTILSGYTFVITGVLSEPRSHFVKLIEEHSGNVSSAISSKTSYLLAGSDAGSKLEKAYKTGTKVINEEQFYDLIKQ
ncbi:NAD-dependent DNA ligase LigA [Mycoplasmopsis agalactiae]|nr:NAD-dependent DNA ligase LigA [Mycoplasmopsis agalactiae]MCE6056298.1 NAD-dependent DNA ligase LigA [Mycoplasmopsis agalactiae]